MLTALQDAGLEDDGDIAPEAAARRALKIAILHHIAQCDRPDVDGLLTDVLAAARGMTMRIRILGMMLQRSSALAGPALAAFDNEFHDDPLTMDKWFAVQAMTGTADSLVALEDHRSYDRENPNRVRSLLGAFASANLAAFHAADGSGYRLMADRIGALDALNPQLAARLAAAFRTWRTIEDSRQGHARAALASLQERANISPDLSDIVQRTLDG